MVEDAVLRPSVTHVAFRCPKYGVCHVKTRRAWHVLGAFPCDTPSVCPAHYGLCLPVSTHLLDYQTLFGVIDLDVEAIKNIIATRHSVLSLNSSPVTKSNYFPSLPGTSVSRQIHTVADLAAPKRAGRLPGGPDAPSASSQRHSGHRNPAANLFSLELMQTDDVSTIAAQIANQAELIYQAWKTTDLNPSELIHYHSVTSDRSSPHHSNSPFQNSPSSPPILSTPRIPVRSISPAPPGSSPAIPRRVIDIPISTERSFSNFQQPQYQQEVHESYQQQQFQPKQPQQPYPQKQQFQQKPQYQQQQQPQPQQQPQQHASSPVRSLNTSPRPYISPINSDIGQGSPQSPRILLSSPTSPVQLGTPSSRPYISRVTTSQPPPPPERSSSYVESQPQQKIEALGDPDLEASLRELVTNFVIEDKARLASTRPSDRPKSAPSSIQDALQRFERQMAITSRATGGTTENHNPTNVTNVSPTTNCVPQPTSSVNPYTSPSKTYTSGRNESSSLSENWNMRESDARTRRSISPSPPVVSQPGWNEPPPSNTSTWPLKNKQPSSPDRRANTVNTNQPNSSSVPLQTPLVQSSMSPPSATVHSPHSTNYITTLEAHVDSKGRSPGVPIRHKVVTMSGVSKEEERLIHALRKGSLIEDGDTLRPIDNSTKSSNASNISNTSLTMMSSRGTSTTARTPKKFSISVTVDVENKIASPEPPIASDSPIIEDQSSQPWPTSNLVENLSTVDYAKVRFHDAQQRPKTTQRLEDYKTYSNKATVNGDGRVMQAKSRFEINNSSIPEVPWRTVPPAPLAGEVGSTLPEFYRRKLRKMRNKTGSPEPLHALAALPHPQLTDQQKAHIRERSQSPTIALGTSIVVRPFLTQGSVAERVLLFEKAPTELKKTASTTGVSERRRPAFSTWRDPDEVRTKAQETVPSPPSPPRHLEALPSTSPTNTANAVKQSHLREPITTSIANKENARPLPTVSPLGTPTSPVSPQPLSPGSNAISPTLSSTSPPLGMGITGLGSSSIQSARTAGRRFAKTPKSLLIPKFYYPMGRPVPKISQEQIMERVTQCFRDSGGQISRDNMEPLMRACQLPLYWKAPLFIAAGGEKLGELTLEQFKDYWERVISTCHDISSRFVQVLSRGVRNYLVPEDFLSLIQDVVDTHPGLTFLKEATEFHSRYVHTVIARIYYCVNRSWSGRITVPELRRSNLLQVISYLEEEEDINKITDYFSYEHFYVIYCKFWELDTDHDLFIDKHDLAKHNERALSDKIIDRIFSGAVTRGRVQKQDRMGYQEFVWFLISEEDKRHPTAIEYWFRCMDLDGDGYLSMYELEYFYEDQLQRMEALGIETLPFSDCLCQMLDMVRPEVTDRISLSDLKKCRMTPVFFDTFFNFDKYLDHEQRDPFASHRMDDEGPEISDWDRYAAEEYELLVAEEGGGDPQDDMLYGEEDELSMGVDDVLDGGECGLGVIGKELGVIGSELGVIGVGGALSKHSPLSATVPNLAIDHMDVDDDYSDYADSDDYQY